MQELAVLALLVWAVLFRGGKSLDATWLLVGVAGYLTIAWHLDARMSRHQTEHEVRSVTWALVLLMAAWCAVALIASSTRNYGLDELLRTGSLSLIFLWACRHRYREAFMRRFFTAVAAVTAAACAIGAAVYLLQPVNRFVGTFFDARFHTDYWPNAWAEYLLIAWPLILGAMLVARNRVAKIVLLASLGAALGAIALSYSRGAVVALIGQAVVLVIVATLHRKHIQWRSAIIRVLVAVAIAMLAFIASNALRAEFHDVQDVSDKITFTADEGTSSVDERRQFWEQSLHLALLRPITGWGPYSFRFVQPRLQEHVLATSDHPHNVFLKLAMEQGIPAALIFGAFLLFLLVPQVIFFVRHDSLSPDHWLRALALVAALGVIAHNLIDYNLQFVGVVAPLFILLGCIAQTRVHKPSRRANAKRGVEIVTAICLLVIALSEGRYLVLSSIGRHAETAGNYDLALKQYERAENEIFSRDMYLSEAAILARRSQNEGARASLQKYLALNAEDARAWKMLGDISLAESDAVEAQNAYMQAMLLGGMNDLSITHGLLRSLLLKGGSGATFVVKEDVDRRLVAFADGIERNAHFIALSHNVEEFLAVASIMASVYPPDAPTYEILAARVDAAAKRERAKVTARPPGYLW